MSERRISGYCPLCISHCGCVSSADGEVLLRVEPNPEHPTGAGLCLKGRAAPELVHSPDRILHPLRRTNPKGAVDPGWERITWDQALEWTASKLREIAGSLGPEAVSFAVTTPSGTAIGDSFAWIQRLAHAFGSPNLVFATENCNWHKDFSPAYTTGASIGMPDYGRTGCMLLWGFNPAATWSAHAREIREAQKRGAKLIAVDPRQAGLARGADQWLRVRPGTDGILALALAGLLIERDWFDRDFVRDYSNGPFLVRLDTGRLLTAADLTPGGSNRQPVVYDLQEQAPVVLEANGPSGVRAARFQALSGSYRVTTLDGERECRPAFDLLSAECRLYPPERAAALTGVPKEQLIETARLLHESGPVSYFVWTGTAQHAEASQIGRAISILYALTGDLEAPGGNLSFARPAVRDPSGYELLSERQREKCLGYAARPLGPGARSWITSKDLFRAVVEERPYPVKGLVSFGGNLLLTKPNTRHADAALRRLEFYVHADLFMNPTAQFADLFLPVASPWEREGLAAGFQTTQAAASLVQWREPVLSPRGESWSDTRIVFELAGRLGLNDQFFGGDRERAVNHVLEPVGLRLADLRAHPEGVSLELTTEFHGYRNAGFATPSGRVEFYSQRFLEHGYAPLPKFESPPEPDSAYPFVLTSFKCAEFCHSQHRNLPSLRSRVREPLVEIHPDAAAANGISEGDQVRIRTSLATMRAAARFNPSLSPEVICAQYGWWQPCRELDRSGYPIEGESNASYNRLIDAERIDPISGSNALRSGRCNIEKS